MNDKVTLGVFHIVYRRTQSWRSYFQCFNVRDLLLLVFVITTTRAVRIGHLVILSNFPQFKTSRAFLLALLSNRVKHKIIERDNVSSSIDYYQLDCPDSSRAWSVGIGECCGILFKD